MEKNHFVRKFSSSTVSGRLAFFAIFFPSPSFSSFLSRHAMQWSVIHGRDGGRKQTTLTIIWRCWEGVITPNNGLFSWFNSLLSDLQCAINETSSNGQINMKFKATWSFQGLYLSIIMELEVCYWPLYIVLKWILKGNENKWFKSTKGMIWAWRGSISCPASSKQNLDLFHVTSFGSRNESYDNGGWMDSSWGVDDSWEVRKFRFEE